MEDKQLKKAMMIMFVCYSFMPDDFHRHYREISPILRYITALC